MSTNPSSGWLIYGANGYTGSRIAEEAVRRGKKPILAGRNEREVRKLADRLECPVRIFSLENKKQIAEHLGDIRVVLHCAGPFTLTAKPMMDACLLQKVHYLDITGEIPVIEWAAQRTEKATQAGIVLMPAVGFDVVPTDCMAAMLARRLTDATHLQLAFTGTGAVSPGTARTMLMGMPYGGRARIEGQICRVPLAWKSMRIPFRDGPRDTTTIPWGDVSSAWHSTGIPNIEVYMAMQSGQIRGLRWLRWIAPLFKLPLPKRVANVLLRWFISGSPIPPKDEGRGSIWGRATNAEGRSVEATMFTLPGYPLTVQTALAILGRVLDGQVPPGFATPSKGLGAEFILEMPGTEFHWEGDAAEVPGRNGVHPS